jgi:hypothetical protein
MARSPAAQAAHAAQMEREAEKRFQENVGFYDTGGSLSRAALTALGLEAAGTVYSEKMRPTYAGRAPNPPRGHDTKPWTPGRSLQSEPMPRAMHGAQSVYAGKASGYAKKMAEEIGEFPGETSAAARVREQANRIAGRPPGWESTPFDFPEVDPELAKQYPAQSRMMKSGEGLRHAQPHPITLPRRNVPSLEPISKNAALYKKWAGSASEAQKMAEQAYRTGFSPFAGQAVRMAIPAARMAQIGTGGVATLAALPGALALSEGGRAGTPYGDMHFSAFRLLERPLRPDDVGAEDYEALVSMPDLARDLFEVGALSFELYNKAGNERAGIRDSFDEERVLAEGFAGETGMDTDVDMISRMPPTEMRRLEYDLPPAQEPYDRARPQAPQFLRQTAGETEFLRREAEREETE